MKRSLIVISHTNDLHATLVIEKALSMGYQTDLVDLAHYPKSGQISIHIPKTGVAEMEFDINEISVRAEQVAGIWWRRPNGGRKQGNSTPMRDYVASESEIVVRTFRDFIPQANWISDPEATRLASRKPVQLELAKGVGFKIPDTLVSNSSNQLRIFLKKLGGRKLTMKPVGSAFMPLNRDGDSTSSENRVVFTKVIDPKVLLENLDLVRNCPVIFQEVIVKDYDIRVTVVDNDVYAAGVRIQGCTDESNLDWRNYEGERIYFEHELPEYVKMACRNLNNKLGLRFGCIDLGFSKENGYTFFEINPQGQWLPSELKLGYTITESLIKSLTCKFGGNL